MALQRPPLSQVSVLAARRRWVFQRRMPALMERVTAPPLRPRAYRWRHQVLVSLGMERPVQVPVSLGMERPVQVLVSLGMVRSVAASVSLGKVWPVAASVPLDKVWPLAVSRSRAPPAVLFRLSWLRLIPHRVSHCLRMMQLGLGLL